MATWPGELTASHLAIQHGVQQSMIRDWKRQAMRAWCGCSRVRRRPGRAPGERRWSSRTPRSVSWWCIVRTRPAVRESRTSPRGGAFYLIAVMDWATRKVLARLADTVNRLLQRPPTPRDPGRAHAGRSVWDQRIGENGGLTTTGTKLNPVAKLANQAGPRQTDARPHSKHPHSKPTRTKVSAQHSRSAVEDDAAQAYRSSKMVSRARKPILNHLSREATGDSRASRGSLPLNHAAARSSSCSARHTRCAEAGISRWVTPRGASASRTAFMVVGSAPTIPASPTPLTPS